MSDSFVIPRTVAHQDPLSMWLLRQEYWSGLPFPPPGNLIDWRSKSLASPTLTGGFFTTDPPGILFLSSKFVTGHDPTSYSWGHLFHKHLQFFFFNFNLKRFFSLSWRSRITPNIWKTANGAEFNSFPKAADAKVKMVQALKRKNPTTPNPAGHFASF